MSGCSCKLAAHPLIAMVYAAAMCPGFLHTMHRLFSQWCFCSSGFSLPSSPKMQSLVCMVGGLGPFGSHGFMFIIGLLSHCHTSLCSSCLSQYRLSYCWVVQTSSHSESGLPIITSQSLRSSGS